MYPLIMLIKNALVSSLSNICVTWNGNNIKRLVDAGYPDADPDAT